MCMPAAVGCGASLLARLGLVQKCLAEASTSLYTPFLYHPFPAPAPPTPPLPVTPSFPASQVSNQRIDADDLPHILEVGQQVRGEGGRAG
jgi:hypothetical protein